MTPPIGGEERRAGLFSSMKGMIATLVAIAKTRAELLVTELLAGDTRLARALAALPTPVSSEQQQATDETMADYRKRYGL